MASDYGGPYHLHSTHILHSARVPQPQCFDGYIGQELGRVQHQHLEHDQHGLTAHPYPHPYRYPYPYAYPYPYPHPQPQHQPQFSLHPHPHPLSSAQSSDLHEAIQREIEKERIRQEIIMSEILRRRAMEAEIRRELMMESATALQRGGNGFPFGSRSQMGLDLPIRLSLAETMAEERFLDERSMSVMQRHILNNTREGGRSESLPFQRASIDVRTGRDSTARESEVKPVSGGSKGKKKIILEAKPIENITGAKRASPGSGASGTQSDGNLKKQRKVKEEWSCALCQVTATSERILNEHLKGKKHKKKEAAMRAKKSWMGLCTEKVAKPIQNTGTSNPVIEVKVTPKLLLFGKPSSATDGPLALQGNPNSDNLKKEESVVTPQVQKKDEHKKETYKFWCEMCQVGVLTEKVMKMHQQGKKHKRRLLQNQVVEKTVAEDAVTVEKPQVKTMEEDGVALAEK